MHNPVRHTNLIMKRYITIMVLGIMAASASAQGWLDTTAPDRLVAVGARLSINSSNTVRAHDGAAAGTMLDSWGTGMGAGLTVQLNFNNAFGIQPGFFFQSRSHNYSYTYSAHASETVNFNAHEYGHTRCTNFQVPVLAVCTLSPSQSLKWAFEFGPYFNFGLGGSDKGTEEIGTEVRTYSDPYFDARHKFMFGFKMGTTLQVLGHYSFGIHYEAGAGHVWKNGWDGRAKCWSFTLGYDF